jgi:hypothetical protein
MMTTGAAWILTLFFSFINPGIKSNPGSEPGIDTLFWPIFNLDWIATSLVLALLAIAFYLALSQFFSPEEFSWISSLCGVSILVILSDSLYTYLLFWTLLEVLLLSYVIVNQSAEDPSHRIIYSLIFRLLGPILLILAGVTDNQANMPFLITSLNNSGLFLIAAGIFGFVAWWPLMDTLVIDPRKKNPKFLIGMLPSTIGIFLISRGADLVSANQMSPTLFIVGAIFTLVVALFVTAIRVEFDWRIWTLGLLGLIVGSSLLSSSASTLVWGLVYLLPGIFIYLYIENDSKLIIPIIIILLGVIPLPFFPSWSGVRIFSPDVPGFLYAIASGLLIGSVFFQLRQQIFGEYKERLPTPIILIISPCILLFTQLAVNFQGGLVSFNQDFFNQPVSVWIPFVLIIVFISSGDLIIRRDFPTHEFTIGWKAIKYSISTVTNIVDRMVRLIIYLIEGEGGLIWSLLIGFLILTLISLRGGG